MTRSNDRQYRRHDTRIKNVPVMKKDFIDKPVDVAVEELIDNGGKISRELLKKIGKNR